MMRSLFFTWMFSTLLLVSVTGNSVAAVEAAGYVSSVSGNVRAQTGRKHYRKLMKGDAIYEGDRVVTYRKSHINIRFKDNSVFSLGPRSESVIDEYVRTGGGKKESFTASIFKGSFRFISGLIAHRRPSAMRVKTAVATIGIRGTHFAGEVLPQEVDEDGNVIREASAQITLLEPEEDKPTAIEVSNEYGSVVVDKPGYGTEIPDEHSPPSPVRKMQLRTISNVLRAIRASTRQVRVPKPRIR